MIDDLKASRRQILKMTMGATAGAWLLPAAKVLGATTPTSPTMDPDPTCPYYNPDPSNPLDTPTFRALVDTVIPGCITDPTGAPGAIEAGTITALHQMDQMKIFPISLQLVHDLAEVLLNAAAFFTHFSSFVALDLEARTSVVHGLDQLPAVFLFLRLIRAPYYSAMTNRVGFDYLGYPGGPNPGYPDFSFNEADISSPYPTSVGGNLP